MTLADIAANVVGMTDDVMQVRWVARGFTDDVVTCGFCGRDELKGTVRMVALTEDGDAAGEVYAGVVCAAKRAGRKAAEIRTEATRYDREQYEAARAAWSAWSDAHSRWVCATRDAALGITGWDPRIREYLASAEFRAAEAEWLAEHPEPSREWRGH